MLVVPLPASRVITSGESGVTHSKVIWLRSRNRRSAPQAGSKRSPKRVRRGFGGSEKIPWSPPMRSRASAPIFVDTSVDAAAIV